MMRQTFTDTISLIAGAGLATMLIYFVYSAAEAPDNIKLLFAATLASVLSGIVVARMFRRRYEAALAANFISKAELEQYCQWLSKVSPLYGHTWQYFGSQKHTDLFEHIHAMRHLADEQTKRPITLS